MSSIKDVEFSLKRKHLNDEVKAEILKNIVDRIVAEGWSVSAGEIVREVEGFMNNGSSLSPTAREYLEYAVKQLINKKYDELVLFSSDSPVNSNFHKYIDFILLIKELIDNKYTVISDDELVHDFTVFFSEEKYSDPGNEEYERTKEFFTKLIEVSQFVLNIIQSVYDEE